MAEQNKSKPEVATSPFPNFFWEQILLIRRDEPKRFNLFSLGLKRSAEIYEQQRERHLAAQKQAA
jgi:hypothetical protein